MMRNVLFSLSMFAFVLCAGSSFGQTVDVSGNYWGGELYSSIDGSEDPKTKKGVMTIAGDQVTRLFDESNGGVESSQLTVVGVNFDADGWMQLDMLLDGTIPMSRTMAYGGNILAEVVRDPLLEDMRLGVGVDIRRAEGLTSGDVVGEYAYFGHYLDHPAGDSHSEYGLVRLYVNGNFDIWDIEGYPGSGVPNYPDGNGTPETGTWSLDGASPQLLLNDTGNDWSIQLGEGGVGQGVQINPLTWNDVGMALFVKKSSGKTAADLAGHYLMQGLLTDGYSYPHTEWGTLDVELDGQWAVNIYTDGTPNSAMTINGIATIDDDGTVNVYDNSQNLLHKGVLNENGEFMALSALGNNDEGYGWYTAVRTVCIPGDVNCDSKVSLLDLDILGSNWGESPALRTEGDLSGNGEVSLLDLDILGEHWGDGVVVTPEPAGLSLVLACTALAMGRRYR